MNNSVATPIPANRKADALALLVLFLLIGAPFITRILLGVTALSAPLTHDIGFQWIPFRLFIKNALAQGVFPLWADQVFAGFPFAAFSHTGVFYPLGWLFLLGDYARVVNYFYPIHLCIAAAGVYALSRRLGLSVVAAWLAALTYVFTGKPFYFIHFLPSVCGNVWVPWFLFSALGVLKKARLRDFLLAGLFLALQVLGGDVESTAYGLLFALPALVVLRPRTSAFLKTGTLILVGALVLALLFSLVQLLPLQEYSRHFVRNQGETFAYFSRRELPLALMWALIIPAKGIASHPEISLDAPYFYLGFFTLALAGYAVMAKAASSSRALGVLALLALAWSFGSFSILERLQFLLPLLGRFGAPEHAFFMAQLFIALIAGQGLDSAAQEKSPKTVSRGFIPLVLLLFILLIGMAVGVESLRDLSFVQIMLVMVACGLFMAARKAPKPLARKVLIWPWLIFLLIDIYLPAFRFLPKNNLSIFRSPPWLPKLANELKAANSRAIMVTREGLRDPDLLYHAGLGNGLSFVDGWITTPPRRYAEVMALADPRAVGFKDGKLDHLGLNTDLRDGRFIEAEAMPVLDLLALRFVIDRGLPLKFSSPFYLSYLPPDYHRRLVIAGAAAAKEKSPERSPWQDDLFAGPNEVYRWRLFVSRGDMLSFVASAFHEDVAAGSASCRVRLEVKDGETVENILDEEMATAELDPLRTVLEPRRLDLSRFFGHEITLTLTLLGPKGRPDVYFWLVPQIINPEKPFRLLSRPAPEILVYENAEALPRAFVVHYAEIIADEKEMMKRLGQATRYELSTRIFLSAPAAQNEGGDSGPLPGGAREFAEPARFRPGEAVYQVSASRRGFLFLSDQYYPGWRAYVEGEERKILRADYNFRAIAVPAGSSLARLVYVPFDFRIGMWVTMVSAAIAVIIAVASILRKRARREITIKIYVVSRLLTSPFPRIMKYLITALLRGRDGHGKRRDHNQGRARAQPEEH